MKFTLNCKAGVTQTEMSALLSAPSDEKVNWAQKCSLKGVVEWEESEGEC